MEGKICTVCVLLAAALAGWAQEGGAPGAPALDVEAPEPHPPDAGPVDPLTSADAVSGDEFLVLGDPATHLLPLDAAWREARDVARFLGTRPLLGEKATEAAFWRGAGDATILHIAAHGVYEPEHPLFSRLQLAPGEGDDGFLHVHEIWDRLVLRRARLVVLSACETAAGEPTRGDDILGLTQAFLVAGAPTVIATLWPVDDPASAALMTSFYRHFRGGATAGEALRRAQLERLESPHHAAPYFWAGYTLFGRLDTRWHETAGGAP